MKICKNCIDYDNCFQIFGLSENTNADSCPEYKEKKKYKCKDCEPGGCGPCCEGEKES